MMEIKCVDFSLKPETRGHACLRRRSRKLTIYLSTVKPWLLDRAESPFTGIEDLIEELVIHETLHTILGRLRDKVVDSWHRVLCHLDNSETNVKQTRDCSCSIDCFWRDCV